MTPQRLSEHVWTCSHDSLYILTEPWDTIDSHGIPGPAVNHYYQHGQGPWILGCCVSPRATAPGNWSLTNCMWMRVCVCVCACVFVGIKSVYVYEHMYVCRRGMWVYNSFYACSHVSRCAWMDDWVGGYVCVCGYTVVCVCETLPCLVCECLVFEWWQATSACLGELWDVI